MQLVAEADLKHLPCPGMHPLTYRLQQAAVEAAVNRPGVRPGLLRTKLRLEPVDVDAHRAAAVVCSLQAVVG